MKNSCSEATKNLSIRSLVILTNIKDKGFDWKLFADELLVEDTDTKALIDLKEKVEADGKIKGKKTMKLEDVYENWRKITGKSRSTFMRTWAKLKPKEK